MMNNKERYRAGTWFLAGYAMGHPDNEEGYSILQKSSREALQSFWDAYRAHVEGACISCRRDGVVLLDGYFCEGCYAELSPPRRPLDEEDPCPVCDYPFDSDEWDERHLHGGPSAGETWIYTCPKCGLETCDVGV